MLNYIQTKFPWIIKKHFVPNYFLNGNQNQYGNSSDSRSAVTVFMHSPRTSGSEIIKCLKRLMSKSSDLIAPAADEHFRLLWDNDISMTVNHRHRYNFHAGRDAFGICDFVPKKSCAYFTIARNPFDQAVSTYFYCQSALGDPLCKVMNANRVSIKEWILLHSDTLFRHFLFHSDVCQFHYQESEQRTNEMGSKIQFHNPDLIPCWYKHKMWLNNLSKFDKEVLLQYILDQLEKWFVVVGVSELLNATLTSFEQALNLPITKCKLQQKFTLENVMLTTNVAYKHPEDNDSQLELDHRERQTLLADNAIKRALQDDFRIYHKIRDITQLQIQRIFNRLKN